MGYIKLKDSILKNKWLNRQLILAPHYILCLTEADYKKTLAEVLPEDDENYNDPWVSEGAQGTCHIVFNVCDSVLICIVCVNPEKGVENSVMYGLLIHEAVHVYNAMRDRNIYLPYADDEFMAISIQAIAQNLIESYVKQTQKTKKKKKEK